MASGIEFVKFDFIALLTAVHSYEADLYTFESDAFATFWYQSEKCDLYDRCYVFEMLWF